MRNIILLVLLFTYGITQAQYHGMVPYDIGNGIKILAKIPHGDTANHRFPVMIMWNGNGEIGTDYNTLGNIGLGRAMFLDSAIMRNNYDSLYGFTVLPVSSAATMEQPTQQVYVMDWISSHFKTDTTNWAFAGISQGAVNTFDGPSWDAVAIPGYGTGAEYEYNRVKKFIVTSTCNTRDGHFERFAGKGGRFIGGLSDGVCFFGFTDSAYARFIRGGGYGTKVLISGGQHDNTTVWDLVFRPSPSADTSNNIYKWVMGGPAVPNTPPIAYAPNVNITLPTSTATLVGSGSFDPDGSLTAFSWVKLSGPNTPTISTPTTQNTNIVGVIQGTYVYTLTVTDNGGAQTSWNVTLTVLPSGVVKRFLNMIRRTYP